MKVKLGLINVSLVDGCNLACRWCDRPDNFNYIDLEDLKVIVDKINKEVEFSPYFQLIGAGEALLHKQFKEALNILGDIKVPGMRKELWTNLTIRRKGVFEEMLTSNVLDGIVVSFDGYGDKASFEFMRKGAKFEQLVKNVEELCELRDKLNSRCSIGVTSIYPEAGSIPFDHIDSEQGYEQYRKIFPNVDNIMFRKLHRYNGTFEVSGMPVALNGVIGPCPKVESGQLIIDTKGNVHPCCQDINHAFNLGNVLEDSISDLMFKGAHQQLRDDLRSGRGHPVCNNCDECKYSSQEHIVKVLCNELKVAKDASNRASHEILSRQEFIDQQVTVINEKQQYIDAQRKYIDEHINT